MNFLLPKLVAVLNQCKLSVRKLVNIIQATDRALGHHVDSLFINKSYIDRCCDSYTYNILTKSKSIFKVLI